MYYLLSLVLGIVEGLTEFLPVSSTAHLRLTEQFIGISLQSGYWKMYSVVIQLGAILSVLVLFMPRILEMIKTFPRGKSGNRTIFTHPLSMVMIAFIVTAGPCYYAEKHISNALENLQVMAAALLIGGIVMWLVDAFCTRPKISNMDDMSLLDAVWVGFVQIFSAAFPGTSRSMVTIAGGQIFGMSRSAALEFSFFLSIPTMFAATLYKLSQAMFNFPKSHDEPVAWAAPDNPWVILAIGFVVSFIVAVFVNKWFINWVRTRGFGGFALYRIVLGGGLLVAMLLAPAYFEDSKAKAATTQQATTLTTPDGPANATSVAVPATAR